MDDEPLLSEETAINGINVTPLVDVCLVLVLIFMVTTPFLEKPLLEVVLPKAVAAEAETRENITVSISARGEYAVNEMPMSRRGLETELKVQRRRSGIDFLLIRADERVSSGEVRRVMKMGQRAGLKRVAFLTEPKGR